MIHCLLILLLSKGWAAQLTEDFSSLLHKDSATAVWNQYLGKAHPTLQVMNFKAGFTPYAVDVGDGSHGVFDSTTYSQFSSGGDVSGNIIRLDTSIYPVLKVTNFVLEAGWTLVPVGGNPLKIYSLGQVIIRGEIWCHGTNGGNGSGMTPGSAGLGRCGGSNGGIGGGFGSSGANGVDISAATVTGGQGGNYTGTATVVGGGGGGSWNTTSQPGNDVNASGSGGTKGTSTSDPEFTLVAGGAGGGGGAGVVAGAGGGGGGGGGAVVIHSVGNFDLGTSPASTTGFIFVSGGAGGDPSGGAGPGGGGGGGSVQVFSGGTINIYNTDVAGASRAELGAGGTGGANGGPGRSWFSSVNYNGIGFYTPGEQAPVNPGNVEFSSSAQEVVTVSRDIGSTLATFDGLTTNPVSADFQILINGSSDDFSSDSTGWTTDLSIVKNKRYYKLKVIITTSNVNVPTMLDSVVLDYTPGVQSDFRFKASGCGAMQSPGNPYSILFVLMPFCLGLWLRFKSKNQFQC
jgi:hypothetical protein